MGSIAIEIEAVFENRRQAIAVFDALNWLNVANPMQGESSYPKAADYEKVIGIFKDEGFDLSRLFDGHSKCCNITGVVSIKPGVVRFWVDGKTNSGYDFWREIFSTFIAGGVKSMTGVLENGLLGIWDFKCFDGHRLIQHAAEHDDPVFDLMTEDSLLSSIKQLCCAGKLNNRSFSSAELTD